MASRVAAAPALFALLALPCPAWNDEGSSLALETWREAHGPAWTVRVDGGSGHVLSLLGGSRPAEALPQSDADWIELALAHVGEAGDLLDIDPATLEGATVHHLALERIGTTDKTAVVFRQGLGGIPVVGGGLRALFGPGGELLSLDASGVRGEASCPTVPRVDARLARVFAHREFTTLEGRAARRMDPPQLAVLPPTADAGPPRLAWVLDLFARGTEDGLPSARRVFVSADGALGAGGGEVLRVEQRVHHAQQATRSNIPPGNSASGFVGGGGTSSGGLVGYVRSWATPGLAADGPWNPPALLPMRDMQVDGPGGSDVTDALGRFDLGAWGAGTAQVTLRYRGPWAQVFDAQGSTYAQTVQVASGTPQTWRMNDPATEGVTAQANVFRHVSGFREWLTGLDPSDTTFDFQVQAQVNVAAHCNAVYIPGSDPQSSILEFWEAGSGCSNSAYSTVIVHEEGHMANDAYYTPFGGGQGTDGFGEGAADAWSMYVLDTQFLGEWFYTSGGWVRDGENARQFCGDTNPGCYGAVHDDGEVLMGALWKTRRNLKASLGSSLGGLTADVLLLSWFQAYDDNQIRTLVRDHWLVLDDDDGDLSNGTPHFAEIDGAFQEQGFPPYTTIPIDTEDQVLVPADSTSQFGTSVAVDANWCAIGAPGDDDTMGLYSGAVYAFEKAGGAWQQRQKLFPLDPGFQHHFGGAVDVEGSTMIVGSSSDDSNGSSSGSAYIFVRSGTTWTQQAKLLADTPTAYDHFGNQVALSGSRAVVNAIYDDVAGPSTNDGAAYVFLRNGSSWTQEARLVSPYLDQSFADSVAIGGDRIAVSSSGDVVGSNGGAVNVFRRVGTSWVFEAFLEGTNPFQGQRFGWSLALDGDSLVVGAMRDHGAFPSTGTAYAFRRSGNTWTLESKVHASDVTSPFVQFGQHVALKADTFVVGTGTDGYVYTFERTGSTWAEANKWGASSPSLPGADSIARSLAISDTEVIAGTYVSAFSFLLP